MLPPLPSITSTPQSDRQSQQLSALPQSSGTCELDVSVSAMSASFNFGVRHLHRLRSDIERKSGLNLSTPEGQLHLHLSNCARISRCEQHLVEMKSMIKEILTRPSSVGENDADGWKVIGDWQAYIDIAKGKVDLSTLVSDDDYEVL